MAAQRRMLFFMDTFQGILVDALYLLALINPVSKISVLAVFSSPEQRREMGGVVARSSLIAAGILLATMVGGDFVLRTIFHVDLHSLRVAGGIVLSWVGFNALRKGVFFDQETQARFADIAIVPLACPMIAGPATIAASLALTARHGFARPACAVVTAVVVNYVFMMLSGVIASVLTRFNILGAIIRITGLVVMTMGVQMVLTGAGEWIAGLPNL